MMLTSLERIPLNVVTEMDNFVVNTAVANVTGTTGTDLNLYSSNVGARRWFQYNEGILLKSIYVRLPYQFTWAVGNIALSFNSFTNPATSAVFTEVGTLGLLNIPVENTEFEINTFLNPPAAALANLQKWCLRVFIFSFSIGPPVPASISMIGAPAILNGVTLPIYTGVKVLHSYEITQNP